MRSSHSTAACAAVTKLTATGWSTFTSTVLAIGERAGVRAAVARALQALHVVVIVRMLVAQ